LSRAFLRLALAAADQLPAALDAHAMRGSHFILNLAYRRSRFLQENAPVFCRQTLSFFAGKRSRFLVHFVLTF
jgi:hypothetical protein